MHPVRRRILEVQENLEKKKNDLPPLTRVTEPCCSIWTDFCCLSFDYLETCFVSPGHYQEVRYQHFFGVKSHHHLLHSVHWTMRSGPLQWGTSTRHQSTIPTAPNILNIKALHPYNSKSILIRLT